MVLHVRVPGIWADDMNEMVAIWTEDKDDDYEPTARDMADWLTHEAMREEVGITIVTLPTEKSMNDDFLICSYTGIIVGAEVTDER